MSPRFLESLLLIDPSSETIYGIVGRMEVLRSLFASDSKYRALLPFLEVYYRVTKAVMNRQAVGGSAFDNPQVLEYLDVQFASLYFNALHTFLITGECVMPWRTYFEYCQKSQRNAFVCMLLGINAHINGDLPYALAACSYSEYKDFVAINSILQTEIRGMLAHLAYGYGDGISLGAWLLPRTTVSLFQSTIVQWRSLAWQHASVRIENRILHSRTESAAKQLADIFKNPSRLLRVARLEKDLARIFVKV